MAEPLPVVRLKNAWNSTHPWIFQRLVEKPAQRPKPGSIVEVVAAGLGAAALGDIGTHFPDTDPAFRGADSSVLLAEAGRRVRAAGFEIANVDSTVVAQAPRLAAHIPGMRACIAQALGLAPDQVNVKAKTAERLGPVGQGLAMEARAATLVYRR